MSDVDVHETIVDEQCLDNKVDELVLENIEPVSNTKTQDKINTNFLKNQRNQQLHGLASPQ